VHGLHYDPTAVEIKSISSGSGNYRTVENIWTGKTATTQWEAGQGSVLRNVVIEEQFQIGSN